MLPLRSNTLPGKFHPAAQVEFSALPPGDWDVPAGVYHFTESVSVSAGVTLRILRGAVFRTAGAGVIVTLNAVEAGDFPWIDTSAGGQVRPQTDTVTPVWWGAARDESADTKAAWAAAYDALPATGGTIRAPRGRYRFSGLGADLANPVIAILNNAKPNVWVRGDGSATIVMTDFDRAAANAIADPNGEDVFTFAAFDGVSGGGVYGINFEGEGDGIALGNLTARAKGVGVTNSARVKVSHVNGTYLAGNVVNFRGGLGGGVTVYCTSDHIAAEYCCENGVNYMGGTKHCGVDELDCHNNGYQGFESGCDYLTATNIRCSGNKNGVSHVGRKSKFANLVLTENTFSGFNFQYNNATFNGSDNQVTNLYAEGNLSAGVIASGSTKRNKILGGSCKNNGDVTQIGEGIKLSSGTDSFTIIGVDLGDDRALPAEKTQKYGINALSPTNLVIRDCPALGVITTSILVQVGGDKISISGCNVDKPITVSAAATNVKVHDNPGHESVVWTAPALQLGWVNFGGNAAPAGYTRDENGWVTLRGMVKDGAGMPGIVVFTLPEGYRPAYNQRFAVNSNNAYGMAEVQIDGDVVAWVGSALSFCLDGIRFKAA